MTRATTSLFDSFAAVRREWAALLTHDADATVFSTPGWLRTWWDCFGRGRLVCGLVAAGGEPRGLASLFVEDGVAYPVGSGGSDYLDLLGDRGSTEVWASFLERVFDDLPDLDVLRWYHVPSWSPSNTALPAACAALGLRVDNEGTMAAPALDLRAPGTVSQVLAKKSVRRNENWFGRDGDLAVHHDRTSAAVLPWIDEFFDQHERRWAATDSPSLFHRPQQRDFYRRITEAGAREGWLRFTRVMWQGRPVAFHFGFRFGHRYVWYKPSYDTGTPKSPGEVLLTALIRAAVAEDADVFDFGLGDEPFKHRFSTHTASVTTWGIHR